jgi:cation diffusion facilitator family transporter
MESVRTIIVAAVANLGIALAKAVGGILSGSSAMLSEAAHSVADTTTEVLLLVAVRRGGQAPDQRHPFGYGRAAFVWALIAAGFTFVAGGGFAITQGIHNLSKGTHEGPIVPSLVILAVAAVLESVSLAQGLRQARGEAAKVRVKLARYVRNTPNTAVKAVVLEDIAALIGLALAAAGLLLSLATGSAVWDAVASILIGVLLVGVAANLIRSNASLLIGRSLPLSWEKEMAVDLASIPSVASVAQVYTSLIGMSDVFVAARVNFDPAASAAQISIAAAEAERRLTQRYSVVRYVMLSPAYSGERDMPES